GVGMAGYLGMKLGRRVVDTAGADTVFDTPRFPSRPLYTGTPWFLAPSVLVYRIRDRFGW
ncbi:MAG: FAD-dependent oxidoreductase, partial [Pseudomonadota bacterium]